MRGRDAVRIGWQALAAHRLRTRMTYAAVAVGVAAVLVLTGLGQGARGWIVAQFSMLGSNVLVVLPGRTETRGRAPLPVATTRDLTLDDARALARHTRGVASAVPLTIGQATASFGRRGRATTVIGSTRDFLRVRDVAVDAGVELPEVELEEDVRVCVIGRTVARELFGSRSPLGEKLRLGDYAFRIVGVIGERGSRMMIDVDEMVLVPVASALRMFDRAGLFRIIVEVAPGSSLDRGRERVSATLRDRHDGEEDFTVLTPGAVAASLAGIVGLVTAALAGIAAISLAVAGIGVMNVMIVSVTERASEIGLMKAIGASNRQVLSIFLCEAVALTLTGGLFGVAAGIGLTRALGLLYPDFPFAVPDWAIAAAFGVAAAVGVVFGIAPAMRAARLEPLEALRRKV